MPFLLFDDVEQLSDFTWKITVQYNFDNHRKGTYESYKEYKKVGVKVKEISTCNSTHCNNTRYQIEKDCLLVSAIRQETVNYKLTVTCTDLNSVVNNMNIPLNGQFVCISKEGAPLRTDPKFKYIQYDIIITKHIPDPHPFENLLNAVMHAMTLNCVRSKRRIIFLLFDDVEQLSDFTWKITVQYNFDNHRKGTYESYKEYKKVGVKVKEISTCNATFYNSQPNIHHTKTDKDCLLVSAIKQETVNYKLTVTCTDLNSVVNDMNIPLDGQFVCITKEGAPQRIDPKFNYMQYDIIITKNIPDPHPFENFLNADEFYDFELCAKQTEENVVRSVRVHKLVLMASSPVFKTMLSGQWKETTQGSVELPAEMTTLEALKNYIYTGQLPQELEEVKKLLPFSKFYMMPQLENACSSFIMANVTNENFREYLKCATDYSCNKLLSQLISMMRSLSVNDVHKICSVDRN